MKKLAVLATAFLLACPAAALWAMGDEPSPAPRSPRNADYDAGKKAIEAHNYRAALESFNRAAQKEPNSADVQNYIGYTYREMGNLDMAFKHYEAALSIDPRHKGALEYVGEAYLIVGNLPKAEEKLAQLDKVCVFSCEQYRDLKQAIAEYKKNGTKPGTAGR